MIWLMKMLEVEFGMNECMDTSTTSLLIICIPYAQIMWQNFLWVLYIPPIYAKKNMCSESGAEILVVNKVYVVIFVKMWSSHFF